MSKCFQCIHCNEIFLESDGYSNWICPRDYCDAEYIDEYSFVITPNITEETNKRFNQTIKNIIR